MCHLVVSRLFIYNIHRRKLTATFFTHFSPNNKHLTCSSSPFCSDQTSISVTTKTSKSESGPGGPSAAAIPEGEEAGPRSAEEEDLQWRLAFEAMDAKQGASKHDKGESALLVMMR